MVQYSPANNASQNLNRGNVEKIKRIFHIGMFRYWSVFDFEDHHFFGRSIQILCGVK